ncbi:MAG: limonene-1,2-epoxide hydrolase family protein [Segniliparus sp.]|uniref:limonene-1,2-epoxide hydrolase family protein n=1 Tax=Segniliparus sp. TaxID=2804064 RepID=UPI003F30229F
MALSTSHVSPRTESKEVVLDFLQALHDFDLQATVDLVDERIDYVNVSASRIRGKKAFSSAIRRFYQLSSAGFDVVVLNIAQDGGVVLTERLDTLKIGPVHSQFWVLGRFEVKDGKITVWRDYFDFVNVVLGVLRGLVGAVVPAVRPKQTHQLAR